MRKYITLVFVLLLTLSIKAQTPELDSLEHSLVKTNAIGVRFWFDSDSASVRSFTKVNGTHTLDASFLPNGLHCLHTQVVGNDGEVSAVKSELFLKLNEGVNVSAKSLRYWFDSDSTSVQGITKIGEMNTLDASSLLDGLHCLHMQVVGNDGEVSAVKSELFLKLNEGVNVSAKSLRYWFDSDASSVRSVENTGETCTIDASELHDGLHSINVQVVGNDGVLSSVKSELFLKLKDTASEVKEFRYWFDDDTLNAQSVSPTEGFYSLDASSLEKGEHTISCQLVSKDGTTSSVMKGTFLKILYYVEPDGEGIVVVDNPEGTLADRLRRIEDLKILHVSGVISEDDVASIRELPSLLVLYWDSSQEMPTVVSDGKNENLLVYVDSTATVVGEEGKNIIQHGSTGSVTLADGKPLIVTEEFVAEEVAYTRSFSKETGFGTSSGWEVLTLPFDVQEVVTADGRQLRPMRNTTTDSYPYWLGEYGASGFMHSASIVANVPYVVSMPHNDAYLEEYNIEGDVTFSAKDAALKPTRHLEGTASASYRFMTAYEAVAKSDTVFAINDEEVTLNGTAYPAGSVFVRNLRDVRPFECYFVPLTHEAKMREFISMGANNDANAILAITKDARLTNQDVYSLDGRLVRRATDCSISTNRLSPGVYLIGGKKVLVK